MPVITYVAVDRGELATDHVASTEYKIDTDFEQFPRRRLIKGEVDETLNGTPEGWLDAIQFEYDIVTDLVLPTLRAEWDEFFSSVANREVFQIDFTGTALAIANGGFENGGLSGWSASGSPSSTAPPTNPHRGSYSLRLAGTSVFNGYFQRFAAVAGQEFFADGFAHRDDAATPDSDGGLEIVFRDAALSILSFVADSASAGTAGWQHLMVTGTAPANTVWVDFIFYLPSSVTTGAWYFDDMRALLLGTEVDVWLSNSSLDEQQISGVGFKYSFTAKVHP